ncbi:unnamed protein product, partial [Meganyctiphanes norvegica]
SEDSELFSHFVNLRKSVNLVPNEKRIHSMVVHPKVNPSVKGEVGAPMPGTVIDVRVSQGDFVKKGDPLLVLSAMKMETIVSAPCDGVVTSLSVSKDLKLEGDDLLLKIDPSELSEDEE